MSHLESCPCDHQPGLSGALSTSLLLDPTVSPSAINGGCQATRRLNLSGFALSSCDQACPCPGPRCKTPLLRHKIALYFPLLGPDVHSLHVGNGSHEPLVLCQLLGAHSLLILLDLNSLTYSLGPLVEWS